MRGGREGRTLGFHVREVILFGYKHPLTVAEAQLSWVDDCCPAMSQRVVEFPRVKIDGILSGDGV